MRKEIDLSKFEELEKRENLTIYKYSNKERQSNHNFVYQYFYDEFNTSDYDNAYVLLFLGKVGDGKSTAINALFNIIKGIKLEDNYRLILIKNSGCNEINEGVHLYYLKDYNNKPVIIINCQGYGCKKGIKYDDMLNDALKYVFPNIINHINTICFISSSHNRRLDISTRYIFSQTTNFFTENICENFIILSTFANGDAMLNGPEFIDTIKYEENFINIQKNGMDEKWWFAFDSKSVLDNEIDKLTKYSFSQLNEFYEEKVKKLKPKSIKKCAEVLEARNQINVQINLLIDTQKNLLILKSEENEIGQTIKSITEYEAKKFDSKLKNYKENKIQEQNEIKEKISNIRNQIISIIIKLKLLSQKIQDIAINNTYLKIKDEYIDFVRDRMRENEEYDKEQEKELKKMKENIKILKEVNDLREDEVSNMDDSQLIKKFNRYF